MAAALTAHRSSGALSRAAPARRSFTNALSRPARRQLRPVAVLDVNQDNFEAEVLKVICVFEPHAPACSALPMSTLEPRALASMVGRRCALALLPALLVSPLCVKPRR